MKLRSIAPAGALLVLSISLLAQAPKPKSQKEVEALQKVQAAQGTGNPDTELQAINYVLENFADTAFKPMLLNMAMDASQQKGDLAQMTVWSDRLIQEEPNNIPSRVMLAEAMAQHTRENDLDKDQSLKKVDEYANKGLELLKSASAPPAGVADAEWPNYKKQLTSQAYDALGQSAALRKNYGDAVKQYQQALDAQPTNSVSMARLSKAFVENKQYDDAIATADKVLAISDAPASVKQFAQTQKDNATKLKGSAK